MKRILSLLLLCLLTVSAWAVPARRGTFTVQQPDGTVLTLQLVGDEHFHYYRNVVTGQAMTRDASGQYVPLDAATLSSLQQNGELRRATANAQRMKRLAARRPGGPNRVGGIKPTSGTKKGLVILVNFSDTKMSIANPQNAFYNQFNQEGYNVSGHIGSVRDYFLDQSYGNLTIDFDVVGPVTVSKKMSYYGGNDSDGNDNYPATMIGEAVKLADAAGVDFSKYDWDGDKVVDQVYVIYAGYGEAAGGSDDTIWPHEFTLSASAEWDDGPGALKLDGVTIDTYACSAELAGGSGSTISGIGTACHEFSHCLGFPDFYDTEYSGAFGMDAYDIMAGGSYNGPTGGGEVPSGYTAYERMAAGWLTPTELSGGKTVKGMKDLGTEGEAYVVYNPSKKDEYILFENRKADRWFRYLDNKTAGNGLLAIHVDFDETAWTENTPNNVANHQRMHVIPANKKDEASASAFFPAGAQSLTGTSHSTCGGKWFNGTNKTFDHAITEITASGGLAGFLFDGGGVTDDGSRYTVTFNAGTGSCGTTTWTQTDFGESVQLPTAYPPSSATAYTFIGWSETVATGSKPAQILSAKSYYMPTKDVTLYAVYKSTTAGGSGEGGSYTLDWSKETSLQSKTLGYGSAVTYKATDGSSWVIKAYKQGGLQINKKQDASIKVPSCPAPITTIEITDNTAKVLKFSAQAYNGSNNPTALATSASSTSPVLDLTGKNQTTGYIYTQDGATVITKIVVNYGENGTGIDYQTNPSTADLKTPSISFGSKTQTIAVGDYQVFAATVTSNPGNAAVEYSSSDESVATVGPNTGGVKAQGAGTCTITAKIPAVAGVSREAKATYTLTVTEPATTGIVIATLPTKTTYTEGEKFDPAGMVVKRTLANGASVAVPSSYYSWEPSGALTLSDKKVTVKYYEDGVYHTADVAITVKSLPLYTVTFNAAGGSCTVKSLTETTHGAGVTLPTATVSAAGWSFAGWATASVADNTGTAPRLYNAGSTYKPTESVTLYAVYVHTEQSGGGSGNYELVTKQPSDWSGDYLIAGYDGEDTYFADGRIGGSKAGTGGMGEVNILANVDYNENGEYVTGASGDPYHITLTACTGGYLLQTRDGLYNFRSVDGKGAINNGILTSSDAAEAAQWPITIKLERAGYVTMESNTTEFCLNIDRNGTYFRFYKQSTAAGIGNAIYLYKKQGGSSTSVYCSYPEGFVANTIGALVQAIASRTSLDEINRIVDRILER